MKIDLHSHTNRSDGLLSPRELVQRAQQKGIELLAITDHDTAQGVGDARTYGASVGVNVVTGIEFSSVWQGIGIHIVGLGFDLESPVLAQAVRRQTGVREKRAQQIAEKLVKRGLPNIYADAKRLAGEGQIGRPHFARQLVDIGHVKTESEAFQRYLGSGKIGDVKCHWPAIEEVVDWIRGAGGMAVLAHPDKYKMTRSKLRRFLDDFKACGGAGIEVVSGQQNPDITCYFAQLALEHEFYASCGSDFHGPPTRWSDLGHFSSLPPQCVPVWDLWPSHQIINRANNFK